MWRSLKRVHLAFGAAVVLVVLVASALLLLDVNRFKPRFEAAASGALGMEVRIGGRLDAGLFPGVHLTADDGRIVGVRGDSIAFAKRIQVGIALLPLLRGEVRVNRLGLTHLRFVIVRDRRGGLNVERLKPALAWLGDLDGARVTLSDGIVIFADSGSGQRLEATGLEVSADRVRLGRRGRSSPVRGVSLDATLACRQIRAKAFSVSALKATLHGRDGVFALDPVTMRLFGGPLAGGVRADFTGSLPRWQVRCTLSQFRVEEFLACLSPNKAAEGAMDFAAHLTMQGWTASAMRRSAKGDLSVHGADLVLLGSDLDAEISRFRSSQQFNLVDVGAVFFAGPLGLSITKGYGFASLFRGSGGTSSIPTVASDWTVTRGVARARDVAMATPHNRIALQGGLDFVEQRFADVTVAVVDPGGCAVVRQSIRGSFASPVVEKPHVLASLAGPMIRVYRRARRLFPSGPCEVFYAGSVAPPS